MSTLKLAIVGGGQMGRALAGGLLASKTVSAADMLLVEPAQESLAWWAQEQPDIKAVDLATAAARSDVLLLAVKPDVVPIVTGSSPDVWQQKMVVSIAAGVPLSNLCEWVGHRRVIRVMPNTPCLIREGASAYCCGEDVTDRDRATVQAILEAVGVAVEVKEHQMDAVTGLSGSGPAYVCMMVEALADGGVQQGLSRPLAMKLAVQTVCGTAKLIDETNTHPGVLKDRVASPGGTTIAAISSLEQNGIRAALMEAVAAAAKRSGELSDGQ